MSRSNADILRREQDVIIKRGNKKVESVDGYYDKVPLGGCRYYGNTDLMKQWCPCCKRKNCY
jgi:hypothetical protein